MGSTLAVNPSLISSQVSSNHEVEIVSLNDLERKIDSITNSLSKSDYNSILRELVTINPNNVKTIYEYIIAEQTELNIQDSTIEGKLKVLVWLSNYHKNKSFIDMTKYDILGIFPNKKFRDVNIRIL